MAACGALLHTTHEGFLSSNRSNSKQNLVTASTGRRGGRGIMDAVYNYLEYKKTPVEAGRTDYMSHRQTSTPELEDFSIRQESRGARELGTIID